MSTTIPIYVHTHIDHMYGGGRETRHYTLRPTRGSVHVYHDPVYGRPIGIDAASSDSMMYGHLIIPDGCTASLCTLAGEIDAVKITYPTGHLPPTRSRVYTAAEIVAGAAYYAHPGLVVTRPERSKNEQR